MFTQPHSSFLINEVCAPVLIIWPTSPDSKPFHHIWELFPSLVFQRHSEVCVWSPGWRKLRSKQALVQHTTVNIRFSSPPCSCSSGLGKLAELNEPVTFRSVALYRQLAAISHNPHRPSRLYDLHLYWWVCGCWLMRWQRQQLLHPGR